MGFRCSVHGPHDRLLRALCAAAFVMFGGLSGLAAAAVGGYGWFANQTGPQSMSNLSPGEAERIARAYGEQQLGLVHEASKLESRLPGGGATSASKAAQIGMETSALVMVDARFLSAAGGNQTASKQGGSGAWLFVFRAEGIHVGEWRTQEAALEIQVVLSDVSGRMLQAGVTLLPPEPETAATAP